jgi:hypothetical protein
MLAAQQQVQVEVLNLLGADKQELDTLLTKLLPTADDADGINH